MNCKIHYQNKKSLQYVFHRCNLIFVLIICIGCTSYAEKIPEDIAPLNPPFDMPEFQRPVFPDRDFDILDYGAKAGGKTKNTGAFADAVRACTEAGGGRVLVPEGTWLTGPIHLKSNVNLHLEEGAVVKFSTDFDDYLPVVLTRYEGMECYNYSSPIYTCDCHDVAITGAGLFDGQGKPWWEAREKYKSGADELFEMAAKAVPLRDRIFGSTERFLRPNFVEFVNCQNVLVEGVTFGSGPMWTLHPLYCENVIVRNVNFVTRGPNGDGIDPDSCRNVLIENCGFDTSDDAIGIKSGKNEDGRRVGKSCENIVIRNCRFGLGRRCDGVLSIGSEMSGGVSNVYIHDCTFDKTDRGFRIKTAPKRGGYVKDVWLEDIKIDWIEDMPVLLNMLYSDARDRPDLKALPVFRNINIKNVKTAHCEKAGRIRGLSKQFVEDVTFEDFSVNAEEGFTCSLGDNIKFVNTHIKTDEGPAITLKDSQNVTIKNSSCGKGTEVFLRLEGTRTKNIQLCDNNMEPAEKDIIYGPDTGPGVINHIDLSLIKSPIILKGDAVTAYRDPAAIYHNGNFYLYFTFWVKDITDGERYSYTAMSKSRDLIGWTRPRILTPKDLNLNYSSPGNIIRYKDRWIMCLQSYPTPDDEKYGNENARIWIMKSDDLENFSEPELLEVRGPDVPVEKMGRIIDPYLVRDKDERGKWWCFFDDNAANMSCSYDLKKWTYYKRIGAGENPCVIVKDDKYWLFHSPSNGIGIKRSTDLKNWHDVGRKTTKSDTGIITLGQESWPWAKQRLTAGFVLDMTDAPSVDKYIMFFHAEPPGGFKKFASIGIAWSDELINWAWPGKDKK